MTDANLSSIYSGTPKVVDVAQNSEETTKARLFESLLEQHLKTRQWVKERTEEEWIEKVFKDAAFYEGFDELLWGQFFTCVYKDPVTSKMSALIIDKLGVAHFNPVDLSSKSQYYPAIENLDPKDRESNVRKCIAVSLLEKFAQLPDGCLHRIQPKGLKFDYDPTHAGDLASGCKLVDFCTPENIGRSLRSLGILGNRYVQSTLLDVVYENTPSTAEPNNRMVFNLGEQLEQLFDPLNEYSPEQTEYTYKAPEQDETTDQDSQLVRSILKELLELQMTFTMNLVEFLQTFLINLRIQVLNNEIEGLSTVKLNRLFPPTIDEVTRINCIFLDSLKSATPYGSSEVLKACSVTIPYFYKAYTRHEAATKNFSKDIKLFLRRFNDVIPEKNTYTEMKIETIIKGPQEKLMKIKLIIDRLYAKKEWPEEAQLDAERNYNSVIQVIDSFGNLESPLSSYSTRVFTPSGKILTELAKEWPVELQYKWLKRRIVGIFDVVDANDSAKRKLLVIFSDYVVFLDINQAELYYSADGKNRPQMADILMNSLINEVPLPSKIPKLTVNSYCFIDDVLVSLIEGNAIRFDALKVGDSFSVSFKLASSSITASSVAELVVKAKILEKETAFHLFRATQDDMTIYSTAHELEAYQSEKIKSKFSVFLNMEPSKNSLLENKLHLGIFLKFVKVGQNEEIQLEALTSDGRSRKTTFPASKLVSALVEQLLLEVPVCDSSIYSPLYSLLVETNEKLVGKIGHHFNPPGETLPASNNEHADTFFRDHEKKKSFGTITTYRSHASDLKDTTNVRGNAGDTHSKHLLPASDTPARRVIGNQNNLHNSKKIETAKKRRSIIDLVKGIFGGKRSRDPVTQEKSKPNKQERIKKPSKKSKKATGGIDRSSISKPSPENTGSDGGKQRISSIVQNHDFSPLGAPMMSPKAASTNSNAGNVEKQPSAPQTEEETAISPHPLAISTSSHRSVQEERRPSSNSTKLTADSANQFYRLPGRQSQLFDDDLFGELGTGSVSEKGNSGQESANEVFHSNKKEKSMDQTPSDLSKLSKVHKDTSPHEELHGENTDDSNYEQQNTSSAQRSSLEEQQEQDNLSTGGIIEDKRVEIFPSIPPPKQAKINFQRSSSFIELFEGMRLILDDSDAHYNWKCLSNDVSLRKDSVCDKQTSIPHAFKSIAIAATEPAPISPKKSSSAGDTGSRYSDVRSADSPECQEPSLPFDVTNNTADGASPFATFEKSSIEDDIDEPSRSSPRRASPGFKVVRSSPTRIVKRPLQSVNLEAPDQSLTYNFSIPSDLNQAADKRWFELKLPSQEDLHSEVFHTPHEEPSAEFPDEQRDSETPSPFESNPNANETSQDTITSNKPKQKSKDEILEDLEFSSFHMTFDNTEDNAEESPYTAPSDAEDNNSPNAGSPLPHAKEGPLLYRLPMNLSAKKSEMADSKRLSTANSHGEDDPIWVSPSKLDFYDLSDVAISKAAKGESRATERLGAPKESTTRSDKPGADKNSLRELSYAYLASLVSPTESSFETDDKPVRLHFEE